MADLTAVVAEAGAAAAAAIDAYNHHGRLQCVYGQLTLLHRCQMQK